jgi:hypothetical protein
MCICGLGKLPGFSIKICIQESMNCMWVILTPHEVRRRKLFRIVKIITWKKLILCPLPCPALCWATVHHCVPFVYVISCSLCDSGFIAFLRSSQKVPFVGGLYISISMCTSISSLQTTAVKSSPILEWVMPCVSHLIHGSRFCYILFLLGLTIPQQLTFHFVSRSCYISSDDKQSIHSLCPCPSTFCELLYNCMCCCHILFQNVCISWVCSLKITCLLKSTLTVHRSIFRRSIIFGVCVIEQVKNMF